MKYKIEGGNLPVVICELEAGETLITEGGAMSWMSPNIRMETTSNGKIVKQGEQIVIGGNDMYVSLCRKHYNDGRLGPDESKPE